MENRYRTIATKKYKVEDLLQNVNPYRQTFINFSRVFQIKLTSHFEKEPFSKNDQYITEELYSYFVKNKKFVAQFYENWQSTGTTILEIANENSLDVVAVLGLFNNGIIYTKRSDYKGMVFHENSIVRYFSTFQIIEILKNIKLVDRL